MGQVSPAELADFRHGPARASHDVIATLQREWPKSYIFAARTRAGPLNAAGARAAGRRICSC